MSDLRIYLLEDEIITQEVLKDCLEGLGYSVCGMQDDAQLALKEIEKLRPDFAILDIHVKGDKNGIWLGNQLDIPFIYLTAYNDKKTIREGLKTLPQSYLIKPFKEMEVFTAIELAFEKLTSNQEDDESNPHHSFEKTLLIKDGYTYHKLAIDEINYIKSDDKYLEIHTTDKRFVLRLSLKQFLEDYKSAPFIRVHKSYAVNLKKVTSFTTNSIQILSSAIPLSRSHKDDFSKNIKDFL